MLSSCDDIPYKKISSDRHMSVVSFYMLGEDKKISGGATAQT